MNMADVKQYPYLVKTLITFTQTNKAGVEEKRKINCVFKLDENAGKMPWYALRNYLVPNYLNKEFGPKEVAWQRIYEIKILKQINRNAPDDITGIPLRIMTMDQLDLYSSRWELGVDPTMFHSVEKAREMIRLRQEDEKAYRKHLEDYKAGKKRNYPELDGMRRAKDKGMTVDSAEFDKLDKPVKKAVKKDTTKKAAGEVVKGDPFSDV